MKRTVTAMMLAAAVGGCMSSSPKAAVQTQPAAAEAEHATVRASGNYFPYNIPGATGAWGEPVAMVAPYTSSPPGTERQARRMMSQSVPLDMLQTNQGVVQAGAQMPGMQPPVGMISPPGVPFSPGMMPAGGGMPPPNMPPNCCGPQGCGPSVPPGSVQYTPGGPAPGARPPGAVAAIGAITGPGQMPGGKGFSIGRTQVRFTGPDGMRVSWLTQGQDGKPVYSPPVVETPGRYNFMQASIYRLKLNNIRGRPALEVYPTLEVVPGNPKTEAFLAHSAVPVEFTPQDFQEVSEGKYLVKVIYLPDPQFQEIAATGASEIISTQLEPGADPILEAQRRGCILLVIRMGNVDQEAPNTPPLDSAGQNQTAQAMPPQQGQPGALPPQGMVAQPGMTPPPGMLPPPGMAAQPGMMPQPGMTAPMGPVNAMPGPSIPPAMRGGPSTSPLPPSMPPLPGLPHAPGPMGFRN